MNFEKTSIEGIVEDNLGFVWLATLNGLYRYDGTDFKVYRHKLEDTSSFGTNHITAIFQSRNGTLWVGVDGTGLYRYNRLEDNFTLYRNPENSVVTSRIKRLNEDSKGNIWISTYGAGLCMFDPVKQTYKCYAPIEGDSTFLLAGAPLVMAITKDDKIILSYILPGIKGYDFFDINTGKIERHYLPTRYSNDERISNAEFYSKDEIGIIFHWEFVIYNFTTKKITYHHLKERSGIEDERYTGYTFLDKDRVLLRKYSGYEILDMTTGKIVEYLNSADPYSPIKFNNVSGFFVHDSHNNIWCTSTNTLLEIIYPAVVNTNTIQADGKKDWLVSNAVMRLYEDKDGNIWVGQYGAGLNVYNRKTNTFKFIGIGTDSVKTFADGVMYDFHQDKNGDMWIGTDQGLYLFDPVTWTFKNRYFVDKHISGNPKMKRVHRVGSILEGKNGHLWLGTIGGGLVDFDPKTQKFKLYQYNKDGDESTISDNRIFEIDWDETNKLIWIATYNGGLNAFNPATGKFTRFNFIHANPNGISNNFTWDVRVDNKKGILWLGTDGGGLNVADLKTIKGKPARLKFYHCTIDDGLPDNCIYGVLPDAKGNAWISTRTAVAYIKLPAVFFGKNSSQDWPAPMIFTKNEGMPFDGGGHHSSMFTRDSLLFIGNEGFCYFDPKNMRFNSLPPRVVITDLKIFGKSLKTDSNIVCKKVVNLLYDQNSLTFVFAGLNFRFSEKNQFAYKLNGFDKEWIYPGKRNYAYYTNLDPGTYQFMVKVANNDGIWSAKPGVITLVIQPPFWKTTWFYCLCGVLFIFSIYLIFRWRTRKLQWEKKVLEDKVEERTHELKEQKEKVEEAHKEILDSIQYAKRIQRALLPAEKYISKTIKKLMNKG